MLVSRELIITTEDVQIGDKITIDLKSFGTFTATAQLVTDKDILFMFDDCIDERKMNSDNSNRGGFDKSDLNDWMQKTLLPAFPEDIRTKIELLSLPTYGMMFGHDRWYEDAIEPDNDDQLPLMKKRKNRVADYQDDYEWYWLRNATKKSWSATNFAHVDNDGNASSYDALGSSWVRPVFRIKR